MTVLPIPNVLRAQAMERGLPVVLEHEGEEIVAVVVYPALGTKHAIVTWERGSGLVRRQGPAWVRCSLDEAIQALDVAR